MLEQLVGVQVDAAVKSIAVVEVPVQHQHLRALKILQGLVSDLGPPIGHHRGRGKRR